MEWWVKCGHCSSHHSPLTSTTMYLTSCGHFSCSRCLNQAPIPRPPTSGYCFDCKKPCSVVNLSQKDKLNLDLSFYFKDPSALCQKMLEVYHFQNVHRRRRNEGAMRKRLIQEIVAAQQIRARSERYLPFISKLYEALYVKYGVKPLVQKCEFTPAEVEEFIGEVVKARQQMGRGGELGRRSLAGDMADLDTTVMDVDQRTPAQSPMCTPIQSPMSVRGGAAGRGGERSSLFRARVQSEMRSGGRNGSGGNPSQYTTPTGSVYTKPSPLLSDKRAQQQRPPPPPQWNTPLANHIPATQHPSNQQMPTDISRARNQIHHPSAPRKQIPNHPMGSAGLRPDRMSSAPMSASQSSNAVGVLGARLPVDSRSSVCNPGSLLQAGRNETYVGLNAGGVRTRLSTESPHLTGSRSADPRWCLISSTPGSTQEACTSPVATRVEPAASGSVRRTSNFPDPRLSCASGSSLPSPTSPSSSGRRTAFTPMGSRGCVPANFGPSWTSCRPLPVPSLAGQITSNSVQRKPMSGISVPLVHLPSRLQDFRERSRGSCHDSCS